MQTDVLIIGCGPAGLQAAIHASRSKVAVTVVGKADRSAAHAIKMENYFGFSDVVDGTDLLQNAIKQAKSFGASFVEGNILSAMPSGKGFSVETESGETIEAKAVVIATGMSRVKLNVPGEKEFFGKGVSYCASCDCNFYKGKIAMIVGAQSEAAVSAELMTRYASKTYWAVSKPDVDKHLYGAAVSAGAVVIDSDVSKIVGDGKVKSVVFADGREIETDGVFIELGGKSSADIAMDLGVMPEMDDTIKVNRDCSTEVPGIFACGDITGRPWQVAKAVGEGAVAGLSASAYVKKASE